MEENIVSVNETDELEPEAEVDEVAESYCRSAFAEGIAGGFLAYAVIDGAKKLAKFVQEKLTERKRKAADKAMKDGEAIEVSNTQHDSGEETSNH